MRRRFLQGVPPSADGGLLCPRRQSNQNAAGDAADGLRLRSAPPRSIGPLSPDPIYGGYPLSRAEYFRRAKSEWLSAIPPGPLGPGFAKMIAGAVPAMRLALPNQRSLCGYFAEAALRSSAKTASSLSTLHSKNSDVGQSLFQVSDNIFASSMPAQPPVSGGWGPFGIEYVWVEMNSTQTARFCCAKCLRAPNGAPPLRGAPPWAGANFS